MCKAPKYITESKERLKFGLFSGLFKLYDRVRRKLCEFKAARPDNMSQVVDGLRKELALR